MSDTVAALPLRFEWTLEAFDRLPQRLYSPLFGPAHAPWRLLLYPRGNTQQQQALTTFVSLYLDAPKAHTVTGRVIQTATFTCTLVHPKCQAHNISRNTSHAFSHAEWDWGYANFVELSRLKTEGFMGKGGQVTFIVDGTYTISPYEIVSLDTCVALPVNLAATMLAPLFNTPGTWADLKITATPVETCITVSKPGSASGTSAINQITGVSRDHQHVQVPSAQVATTAHGSSEKHASTARTPTDLHKVHTQGAYAGDATCIASAAVPQAGTSQHDTRRLEWQAVHRLVLASGSPVFRAMLNSNMQEGNSCEVVLQGADMQVLRLLLSWLYGCEVLVPATQLVPLWSLADQYGVLGLCSAVEGCLISLLDSQPHLALDLYGVTRRLTSSTSRVNQVVCEVVQRHLPLCAASSDFTSLSWRHVCHALAVAWDRFSDALESAWQVPHDMLTVLDGVYTWLLHHHVLPQDLNTPAATPAVAQSLPLPTSTAVHIGDPAAAPDAPDAPTNTGTPGSPTPAPPAALLPTQQPVVVGAAGEEQQAPNRGLTGHHPPPPAAADHVNVPGVELVQLAAMPPTSVVVVGGNEQHTGVVGGADEQHTGVVGGADEQDTGQASGSACPASLVKRLIAWFEQQHNQEQEGRTGGAVSRMRRVRCVRDLAQIVDMSRLTPRCTGFIASHPLIQLMDTMSTSVSLATLTGLADAVDTGAAQPSHHTPAATTTTATTTITARVRESRPGSDVVRSTGAGAVDVARVSSASRHGDGVSGGMFQVNEATALVSHDGDGVGQPGVHYHQRHHPWAGGLAGGGGVRTDVRLGELDTNPLNPWSDEEEADEMWGSESEGESEGEQVSAAGGNSSSVGTGEARVVVGAAAGLQQQSTSGGRGVEAAPRDVTHKQVAAVCDSDVAQQLQTGSGAGGGVAPVLDGSTVVNAASMEQVAPGWAPPRDLIHMLRTQPQGQHVQHVSLRQLSPAGPDDMAAPEQHSEGAAAEHVHMASRRAVPVTAPGVHVAGAGEVQQVSVLSPSATPISGHCSGGVPMGPTSTHRLMPVGGNDARGDLQCQGAGEVAIRGASNTRGIQASPPARRPAAAGVRVAVRPIREASSVRPVPVLAAARPAPRPAHQLGRVSVEPMSEHVPAASTPLERGAVSKVPYRLGRM